MARKKKLKQVVHSEAVADSMMVTLEDLPRVVKLPCPECGLPRDPSYAEVAPCVVCGTVGLAPLENPHQPEEDIIAWFLEYERDG